MKTSYFYKSKNDPNAVSIAWRAPVGFRGMEYKSLVPKYWFLRKYKDDGDQDFYVDRYYEEILKKLNPEQVYKELGESAILLCWERPGEFCHRHIVSKWFRDAGFDVQELTQELRGKPKLISILDDAWD